MWPRTVMAMACGVGLGAICINAAAAPRGGKPQCQAVVFEGELNAGQPLTGAIRHGLQLYFQPIASGWIVRILPVGAAPENALRQLGGLDYAEVATPPYQSVTPLSLSTDFAFRSQDAVGWNPRRFRFAADARSFARLQRAAAPFLGLDKSLSAVAGARLAHELAGTSTGMLTILDARILPGSADQGQAAGAVASHFATTAHTIVDGVAGVSSPLGKLVWLRVRVNLLMPLEQGVSTGRMGMPRKCGIP